ncbi:MAG: serine--tRNA ligase [Gemmatales bacterium]|nr:serine--tRNA ligase [Gemmatales bacterium]MDW7994079.1 serine--tRNA ligase [Gemmatales bacterium]
MLDPQFVAENAELVKENCRRRQVQADVDRAVALYHQRRELARRVQALHQRQNELQKQTSREKDAEKRQALIEEGRQLRAQVAELENQLRQVEQDLRYVLCTIPNLTHPDAPVGSRPEDNRVLRTWGEPPRFSFRPKDHVTLAEKLDLVDFEAGSAVSGPKFYFLKNEAVLLELALVHYAFQTLIAEGFTPVITPDLAKAEVVEGIGFLPRGPETQIYSVADTDLCLIATAEITLGGMHRDQLLEESQLPIRYVGLSHCFRTEAGAPGREARGLFRVHQFTKVEMFVFCVPEQSEHWHQELLRLEEKLFQGLGLPYRVVDTCTGELGGPAYRKFDLEAWMPGRGEHGEYAEVTSTSNCTDYQARRLNIRYRPSGQKGTRFVHTLNGTAIATSRAIVAILENYQRSDGAVVVPEVLRPWVGKEVIGP